MLFFAQKHFFLQLVQEKISFFYQTQLYLEINTKITLPYGLQDSAVKLKTQIDLLKLLKTKNAKLIILNRSDHRMSSSLDLNLLEQTIKNMIKSTP